MINARLFLKLRDMLQNAWDPGPYYIAPSHLILQNFGLEDRDLEFLAFVLNCFKTEFAAITLIDVSNAKNQPNPNIFKNPKLHGVESIINFNIRGTDAQSLTLEDLGSLAILDASENAIETCSSRNLPNLAVCNLSKNKLKSFDPTTFTGVSSLLLSHNNLGYVTATNMLSLQSIDISNNPNCTTLILYGSPAISTLQFSGTNLDTFSIHNLRAHVADLCKRGVSLSLDEQDWQIEPTKELTQQDVRKYLERALTPYMRNGGWLADLGPIWNMFKGSCANTDTNVNSDDSIGVPNYSPIEYETSTSVSEDHSYASSVDYLSPEHGDMEYCSFEPGIIPNASSFELDCELSTIDTLEQLDVDKPKDPYKLTKDAASQLPNALLFKILCISDEFTELNKHLTTVIASIEDMPEITTDLIQAAVKELKRDLTTRAATVLSNLAEESKRIEVQQDQIMHSCSPVLFLAQQTALSRQSETGLASKQASAFTNLYRKQSESSGSIDELLICSEITDSYAPDSSRVRRAKL